MIEVVLMLPLFLLGIFFILWIAYVYNSKKALVSSLENGVRLASTRGKAGLFEGMPITAGVEEFKSGALREVDYFILNDEAGGLGVIRPLLEHNIPTKTFDELYNAQVKKIFSSLGKSKLSELPAYYTYALVYAHKAMRMTVGDSVKYPCDPRNPDPSDKTDGENCLWCRPVNPVTMDDTPFDPDRKENGITLDATLLLRRVAIRCDYKPGGMIVRPFLKMLGIMQGSNNEIKYSGVMSHYSYFDAFQACYVMQGSHTYCCNDFNNNQFCF